MGSISGKETKPEQLVRSFLFRKGFRFRKSLKTLIGKPDIVLPKYKTIVFIHGCLWHGHNCKRGTLPVTNSEFWRVKINKNIARDKRVKKQLRGEGWKVLTVWVCELENKTKFERTLNRVVLNLSSK